MALDLPVNLPRLPQLTAERSGSTSGRVLREALPRRHVVTRALGHRSVLELPSSPRDYSDGRSKQTLRRKVREATAHGITWRFVERDSDRRELHKLAEEWEQGLPQAARADNTDLERYDLWWAAFDKEDRPLLLAVIPRDGAWAVLHYFRTIGSGPEQSNARYLMMQVVAEELIARDVRYLVDAAAPTRLGNGLRHFQRMLGFRVTRVRVR